LTHAVPGVAIGFDLPRSDRSAMTAIRLRLASILLAVGLVLCAPLALAHEFKLDIAMNGFVRTDKDEAHLVIRVPLFLFKAVRFPVRGSDIDIEKSDTAIQRALQAIQQDVTIFEDGRPLAAKGVKARLSLPSDRSFEGFEQAVRHIESPIEPDTAITVDQGYVDAHFTYAIRSPESVFAVRTTAGPEFGDYLKLTLRYLPLHGDARVMVLTSRSGMVDLNPTWIGAATGFIGLGIAHIVTGYDHLLFLLCLVIPLRGLRQILTVITGFTLAHSFTLIGSAFNLAPGGAWFPPFVEMVIALSIVYMALEDIIGVDLKRRLLLTMLFGLVHGFGFSYGLREDLQFAGAHLIVALFAFNVGIEIGQVLVLLAMLPALALVQRHVLPGRVGAIILAALLAHVGWHWMGDRWEALAKAPWPAVDAASIAVLLLWFAGLALAGGAVVAVVSRLRLDAAATTPRPPAAGARPGD
jgi:hypothetical protein